MFIHVYGLLLMHEALKLHKNKIIKLFSQTFLSPTQILYKIYVDTGRI